MKANELRIGNLIYWDIPEKINVSHTVVGIVKNKPQTVPISLGNSINEYKPVPITEEWLIKFGFTMTISNKDSGYKQFGINKKGFDIMFSIECNCNPECFVENIGIDILSVHQLQNLYFALTGEELTIEK